MGREIRAMVACGSGIATSTVAANAVQEIFQELGIDVKIIKVRFRKYLKKQMRWILCL